MNKIIYLVFKYEEPEDLTHIQGYNHNLEFDSEKFIKEINYIQSTVSEYIHKNYPDFEPIIERNVRRAKNKNTYAARSIGDRIVDVKLVIPNCRIPDYLDLSKFINDIDKHFKSDSRYSDAYYEIQVQDAKTI